MAATGAEIANAFVTLTVKAPGVQKSVESAVGKADMGRVGSSLGSRLSAGMKKTLKVGAAAIGTTLAAGVGAALFKGMQRLNSLDQATAKLRGLGHSAEGVESIMKNALASVKGTAFGLDAAATTAAGAVAAGIKPGAELEGVLKSVANSAAAAGIDMGEMGGIFNKVASIGKAQNDSLQQVADRGIPIYQALSDQLGVTTDEVFKMASAGEIGFSDFEKAMTTAAGTVADEMGNTVQGSWANFMASLGRIGAGVLGGVWSQLAPVLQSVTEAMGPLENIAGVVGEKIGKFLAPAIEWLMDSLKNGVDFSMFTPLGVIFEALKPVLPVVSDSIKQIAGVIGGALKSALPAVTPLLETVAVVIAAILRAIGPLVKVMTALLVPVLKLLSPLFKILATVLTPIVELLAAVLVPVLGLVSDGLNWLAAVIGEKATVAFDALGTAGEWLGAKLGPVFEAIGKVASWLWENILKPAFNGAKILFAVLGGVIAGIW
ncbi:MAG: tape measure protein, partial [Marinobacter sp.]